MNSCCYVDVYRTYTVCIWLSFVVMCVQYSNNCMQTYVCTGNTTAKSFRVHCLLYLSGIIYYTSKNNYFNGYIGGSGVHVDINCTLRNKIYLFTFVSIVLFETGLICPAIKLIFRLISSVLWQVCFFVYNFGGRVCLKRHVTSVNNWRHSAERRGAWGAMRWEAFQVLNFREHFRSSEIRLKNYK